MTLIIMMGVITDDRHADADERSKSIETLTSRQTLNALGIDDSQLSFFVDGSDYRSEEEEVLVRILHVFPKIPLDALQRWATNAPAWTQLEGAPQDYRGDIRTISGVVKEFQAIRLSPAMADRWQMKQYYRAWVQLDHDARHVELLVGHVPLAWTQAESANAFSPQHVSAVGMFLKRGSAPRGSNQESAAADKPNDAANGDAFQGAPTVVMAAQRIAWHPTQVDKILGVTAATAELGQHRFDVGLLDDVQDRRELTHADREPFYQLMGMERQLPDDDRLSVREKMNGVHLPSINVAQLLASPDNYRGCRLAYRGVARRALRIVVNDNDIRSRFGIDHYYELEVFVTLDLPIRILTSADDVEGRTLRNFPIVACVRDLPPGMREGEVIREEVTVSGNFLKVYAYPSKFLTDRKPMDPEPMMQSPLLVGGRVELTELVRRDDNDWWGLLLGIAALTAIGLVAMMVWRNSQGDRRFQRNVLDRHRGAQDVAWPQPAQRESSLDQE
ncbi:MAG: hypothetical protein R3E01_23470 [Pirellulaceae bacterium]|nr:hypothetical protein [Planctomycetales bacterium]